MAQRAKEVEIPKVAKVKSGKGYSMYRVGDNYRLAVHRNKVVIMGGGISVEFPFYKRRSFKSEPWKDMKRVTVTPDGVTIMRGGTTAKYSFEETKRLQAVPKKKK